MSIRINLLPYREAQRRDARRQFGVSVAASAGLALALMLAAHGVMTGYLLSQESRNTVIVSENTRLDGQIQEIKRLKSEIDALKARKGVIETLQTDRASAVQILDQMVRHTPEGVYLKSIKQMGIKVTVVGNAQSNELVATFMTNVNASKLLVNAKLVEIKAVDVGTRRLSEFTFTYDLQRQPAEAQAKATKRG